MLWQEPYLVSVIAFISCSFLVGKHSRPLRAWLHPGQELPAVDLCSTQSLDSGTNYVGGGTRLGQRRYMLQVEAGTANLSISAVNMRMVCG